MSLTKEFTKGLWEIVPPFRLVLGICATLAVTTTAENGLGMGVATAFVLVCSNLLVSLLRKVIPNNVRIAAYVVIIAAFVVIVELLMKAYAFKLSQALGIFIPLIVVNCIILGRAEAFAGKRGPLDSIADGLGVGIGYTISLTVLGAFREILGSGTIWGVNIFWEGFEPFTFMVRAPGAFVALGIFLAMINLISAKLDERKRRAQS